MKGIGVIEVDGSIHEPMKSIDPVGLLMDDSCVLLALVDKIVDDSDCVRLDPETVRDEAVDNDEFPERLELVSELKDALESDMLPELVEAKLIDKVLDDIPLSELESDMLPELVEVKLIEEALDEIAPSELESEPLLESESDPPLELAEDGLILEVGDDERLVEEFW